jgi:RNA polymerase sigma factor (sigma-70 family)
MLRVLEQSRKQEISNPLAYAYRVADSVIYDKAGRAERDAGEPLDDDLMCDYPLADEVLQHRERVRIFQTALLKLTPLQREIFIKRHFDGKSRQEIADLLDMSVEAVKKHLVRAMAELAGAIDAAHDLAPAGKGGSSHER